MPYAIDTEVQRVLFRPFDFRFTVLTGDVVTNPRREIMSQLERPNIALLATRKATEGFSAFVSRVPCGHKIVGNYDMTTVFAAYRYPVAVDGQLGLQASRGPNLSSDFLKKLTMTVGDGEVAPDDVISYAYAVFHNPLYRRRYAEFLRIDFPRLPLRRATSCSASWFGSAADLWISTLSRTPCPRHLMPVRRVSRSPAP